MVMCGGLLYEEGEDLEEDLVEENTALLPYPMVKLPGGGLKNGSIMEVQDQFQNFKVEIIISHQVGNILIQFILLYAVTVWQALIHPVKGEWICGVGCSWMFSSAT